MKKTLSMLLALCMVVAVVAMPVYAAETELAPIAYVFDVDSFETDTVLSNELLANDPIIKYAGAGNSTSVTYTNAEGVETTHTRYNYLNMSDATTSEAGSQVVVKEIDGEKVLALQSSSDSPAGIATQPIPAGAFADGASQSFEFDFMQPATNFVGQVSLGLAIDGENGLEYLEVNKPTDPTIDNSVSGYTRFTNGGTNYLTYGFASLTYEQYGVASPAVYYSRTGTSGQYMGTNGWQMERVYFADGTYHTHTEAQRKAAMGQWFGVKMNLTAATGGIKVRIHQTHADASKTGYIEYLYPLTEAELAKYDGKLCIVLTGATSGSHLQTASNEFYVKNIRTFKNVEVNAPTYSARVVSNNSFEDMAIGTRPQTASIFAGAANGDYNNVGPDGDSKLTDEKNTTVVLNPAKDKGNVSGKVLAIYNSYIGNDGHWLGFHTPAFDAKALQSADGVTLQVDHYRVGNFNNGRLALHTANADGTANKVAVTDSPSSSKVIAHVIGTEVAPQTASGIVRTGSYAYNPSNNWVRMSINYKMDADGYVTITVQNYNLITGETLGAKSVEYGVAMETSGLFGISWTYNHATVAPTYYFDNIKLSASVMDRDIKVYSPDSETGVYGSSTEVYIELPAAVSDLGAFEEAITVTDSSNAEVAATVSAAIVDGIMKVTLVPKDGLTDDEVYTVSFGSTTDMYGHEIEDVKFAAGADWNPYDPTKPAEVTVDFGGDLSDLPYGSEGAISMADATFGDYSTSAYSVTSSDEGIVTITEGDDGLTYTAKVVGAGTAYITVKNLIAPAEPAKVYAVSSLGVKTTYDVVFIDGETTHETMIVGEGWAATAPTPIGQEGKVFAAWALDQEGNELADFSTVTENMTIYAVYTDGVTVTFRSNDETLGTVSTDSVSVGSGFPLPEVPTATATSIGKFIEWQDAEGNAYTTDELAALTFEDNAEFTAVFAKSVIDIDVDYDFTAMTADDLADLNYQFINISAANAVLDSEKGLSYSATKEFEMYVEPIDSGIYVLEVDYIIDTGSGGANIEMKTTAARDLQGFYPVGTVHTRESTGSYAPKLISNLVSTRDVQHKAKFYFDFDNDVYYVTEDGEAGVTESDPLLLNEKDLQYIRFYTNTGMHYQRIAMKKLDSLSVNTVTVEQPEIGTAVVGAGTKTTYTGPSDSKVQIYTKVDEGVSFDGWTTTGGTIDDATANITFITPGGEDVVATPATSQIMVTFTFEETEYVTFTEETKDLAEQTFAWGEKPTGAPEVNVAEGYELKGWKSRGSDGSLGTATMPTETIVGSRADASATWVPIVSKTIDNIVGSGAVEAQVGETIEVPVSVTIGADATSGYVAITYDPAALEYVGGTVAEALEDEVYFSKIEDGTIRAIINSEDGVTFNGALGTLKFKTLAKGTPTLSIASSVALAKEDETVEYYSELVEDYGTITVTLLKGDVNLDGKINIFDAIAVLKHAANITELTGDALTAADVDGTEGIATTDATTILKYIARIIASF